LFAARKKRFTNQQPEDEDDVGVLLTAAAEQAVTKPEDAPEEKDLYEKWSNNELDPGVDGNEEDDGSDLAMGTFSSHYDVLESVGKGAFGCVKLAKKKKGSGGDAGEDEVYVTKFITKSGVHPTCRVKVKKRVGGFEKLDAAWVPAEVDLLLQLDHPNVVRSFFPFVSVISTSANQTFI
jgi:hypothetical protein